ncbi:MAG: pre-mRNA cleavage and polyadenylation factor (CPF) complex subunit [Alyxoria varia]|nr:MAG: pre-mRNA cleavage and polyadenylation factor (CPF) complex subunit [Alyxoria varia]
MRRARWGSELEQYARGSPSWSAAFKPPIERVTNPANTLPTKHIHHSLNKIKNPINVVLWDHGGRRIITGSTMGEFTLWNGLSFNFETIMSAHDSHIRSIIRTRMWEQFYVSADNTGVIKYWEPNLNGVGQFQGHDATIRDLSFAPTDTYFVSASDDTTLKIWDFKEQKEILHLKDHHWDVKTCDWNPEKGLIASGSKDHTVRLWDPRSGHNLTTLRMHKNIVTKVAWQPTRGVALATAARDQTVRIYDTRMMRDCWTCRGLDHDPMTVTWHPIHPDLLSVGDYDGGITHYITHEQNPPAGVSHTIPPYQHPTPEKAATQQIWPAHRTPRAHDSAVWSLDWHPTVGHILASGSNDKCTSFWTRPRPGDTEWPSDRYHVGVEEAQRLGIGTTRRGGFGGTRGGGYHGRDHRQREDDEDRDVTMSGTAAATALPQPDVGQPPLPHHPHQPQQPHPHLLQSAADAAATDPLDDENTRSARKFANYLTEEYGPAAQPPVPVNQAGAPPGIALPGLAGAMGGGYGGGGAGNAGEGYNGGAAAGTGYTGGSNTGAAYDSQAGPTQPHTVGGGLMDLERLLAMHRMAPDQQAQPPPPPPPGQLPTAQPGAYPGTAAYQQGFPPGAQYAAGSADGSEGSAAAANAAVRSRGPLPSQQESFRGSGGR